MMRIFANKAVRFRLFLILMIAFLAVVKAREDPELRYFFRRQITDRMAIRNYFETYSVRKLHLGAGDNSVPGWLNSDIEPGNDSIYLDAPAGIPSRKVRSNISMRSI